MYYAALGAPRDAGVAGGGHPFDVELTKLPPGATNFPFHAHAAQWEVYLVLMGWESFAQAKQLQKSLQAILLSARQESRISLRTPGQKTLYITSLLIIHLSMSPITRTPTSGL